ncbi:unnamed protein product, partial [Discosporangium mesarthrocarpum]
MTARGPPFYELSFSVKAKVGHGEIVHVCGSCPSLGRWDPSRSLRLETDPKSYPKWVSVSVAMPLDQTVSYKYCVSSGGEFNRWEDLPEPRTLEEVKSPGAAPATVRDVLDK